MTERQLHEYRITFPERCRTETHPMYAAGLIDWRPDPDGWLTVLARTEATARLAATALLGKRTGFGDWANIFGPLQVHPDWEEKYPAGELARITAIKEVAPL